MIKALQAITADRIDHQNPWCVIEGDEIVDRFRTEAAAIAGLGDYHGEALRVERRPTRSPLVDRPR